MKRTQQIEQTGFGAMTSQADFYLLKDYLEMRTNLSALEQKHLVAQLKKIPAAHGAIEPLTAFKIGTQSFLCTREKSLENYWLFILGEENQPIPVSLRKQPYARRPLQRPLENGRIPVEAS